VGRLEPDEAAIRTGEREGLRASIDSGAADDVLERDALVPAMPVLTATEGTRHVRVAAPQEIKDALRGLSFRPCDRRSRPSGYSPEHWLHGQTLFAGKHLASRAAARLWLQASSQSSGCRASQSAIAHLLPERR